MKEKETWLSGYDSRIEPPPKIGRRKQKTEREIEIERWRASYSDRVEMLWSENVCVFMLCVMMGLCVTTLFICVDNVSNLEWMYVWLKVVMCISSLFAAGIAVWGIFYVCIHIAALFQIPYPLPKLKQTYKFEK